MKHTLYQLPKRCIQANRQDDHGEVNVGGQEKGEGVALIWLADETAVAPEEVNGQNGDGQRVKPTQGGQKAKAIAAKPVGTV
jgi:hypothetical protein